MTIRTLTPRATSTRRSGLGVTWPPATETSITVSSEVGRMLGCMAGSVGAVGLVVAAWLPSSFPPPQAAAPTVRVISVARLTATRDVLRTMPAFTLNDVLDGYASSDLRGPDHVPGLRSPGEEAPSCQTG